MSVAATFAKYFCNTEYLTFFIPVVRLRHGYKIRQKGQDANQLTALCCPSACGKLILFIVDFQNCFLQNQQI